MVPDQDSKTEPLREWNRLARENAENAMVSSMYEAGLKASEPIEAFSTWLLIGAASVASLLITSAEKLIPFLGRVGFLACGAFLAGSCLCGLVAKIFALRCKIQIDTGAAVRKTFAEHLGRVINQIPAADCSFCIQASHTMEAAKWIAPRKLRAVLS